VPSRSRRASGPDRSGFIRSVGAAKAEAGDHHATWLPLPY
jgi:hypothetical protein